jgi:Zn-dependent protease
MSGSDEFDDVRLDEDFIRAGRYEPPARTRAAIARYGSAPTSWRQAAPLQPSTRTAKRAPFRSTGNPRSTGKTHGRRQGSSRQGARRSAAGRASVRPSPLFLLTVAATLALGVLVWNGQLGRPGIFFLVLAGWMVSLCLHEFAHALTGFHGGDHSVAAKGYLRLDPRTYQHPFLSFVIPVLIFIAGGIGFPGGAVWIDRSSIRSRVWRSATSFAGPAANVLVAVACLTPFAVNQRGGVTIYRHLPFFLALALLAALQLTAAVLNLLPIPGLDGWGVIEPILDEELAQTARKFATPALLVVMLVLLSVKPINHAIWYIPLHVVDAAGVPRGFVQVAWNLARFWNTN